jgi:hypothetical protein
MVSYLPSGFQALAYEQNCLSLNFLAYIAMATGWEDQFRLNSTPSPELKDLRLESPINDVRGMLWDILGRLDPLSAPLERLLCITHYLQVGIMYYRNLVQTTPIFQDLRAEATDIIYHHKPQTTAGREAFIYHSMLIIDLWKIQSVLQSEGFSLLSSLRHRYPELRQWNVLKIVLQKFFMIPPLLAEWENNWRLLDSSKD